jgi:hypothetical protein
MSVRKRAERMSRVGAEVVGGTGLDPLRLESLRAGPDIGDLVGGQVRLNIRGDVRADVSPRVLALAIMGLTHLALVEHWASESESPSMKEIPELVLSLLLGPQPSPTREP